MNNEIRYFSKGLEWLEKYSISSLLKNSKIHPSQNQTYALQDIHDTLKTHLVRKFVHYTAKFYSVIYLPFQVNSFGIICYKDRHSKKQYLFEIRICFKKTLEITNCDGIVMFDEPSNENIYVNYSNDILSNCNTHDDIIYPSSEKLFKGSSETITENIPNIWRRELMNFYKLISLIKWITL